MDAALDLIAKRYDEIDDIDCSYTTRRRAPQERAGSSFVRDQLQQCHKLLDEGIHEFQPGSKANKVVVCRVQCTVVLDSEGSQVGV